MFMFGIDDQTMRDFFLACNEKLINNIMKVHGEFTYKIITH